MSDKERHKKMLADRARPGERKTITFKVREDADTDYGLPDGEVTLNAGYCPCSVCGHEYMTECYEADCQCCQVTCT